MFHIDSSKLPPRIITILIVLSGAALLAWQARHLHLQMTRLPVTLGKAPPAPRADPQLLQRMFGQAVDGAVASLQGAVLQGCVVAADPQRSHALIRVEGQGALTVFTEDALMPGVVVQQIAHDHVLFLGNGAPLRLDFPSNHATGSAG